MTESVNSLVANLVGAFALAITDAQREAVEEAAGQMGAAPAALVAVDQFAGETVGFFGNLLELTSSGAARLFDRLAQAGLAARMPGNDGRSLAITLTPRGRRLARAVARARRRAVTEALAPLNDDEAAQLAGLLAKALETMAHDRSEAQRLCRLCEHSICDDAGVCPIDTALTEGGVPSYRAPGL
jgi:DNA-binding MarR family transcriptional regulator